MRRKMVQLIVMVATILGLTAGPAVVSRAASFCADDGYAGPTAFVGGRSSGY